MIRFTIALIALIAFSFPAQARHHHHYRRHSYHHRHVDGMPVIAWQQTTRGQIVSHPSGCPSRAFCGCGVSVKVFGHPVRDLFLASNWFKFPHASPAPGMVAVRNHHVMYIQSVDANGNAVVYDPNSGGHQTRIHMRSLSGYSVRNPHGGRYASM